MIELVLRSLWISGTATVMAALWSFPLTFLIIKSNKLKHLITVFEGLVGVPTVLIGLLLYDFLCPKCPLGFLHALYTPQAVAVGEAILVTPLLVATLYSSLKKAYEEYGELALTFGASELRALEVALSQSLTEVLGSVAMAFSRAIGELGVALIVGGNIAGYTRTLSTAIALYTQMGEFEKATELGLILAALSVGVSFAVKATAFKQ